MGKIRIDRERCKGCLLCVAFCPKATLEPDTGLNRRGVTPVRRKQTGECLGCGLCAIICPDCCIEVFK